MFLFAHDEYRTRRMAHDAFGCAAQHRVLQAGVAMSGNNNEVHLQSARCVADLLEWLSESNQRFLDQTRFDRLAFAQQIELCPEDPGNPVVLRGNLDESANEHYTSVANHRPFFDRRAAEIWKTGAC